MYIELITCPNCQRKGRPGKSGFQYNNTASEIYCDCKNTIKITDARDQEILSSNSFARISAASNYLEQGQLSIDPGCAMSVSFKREIDYICKVYLTPNGKFLYAKEVNLTKNGMLIISAKHE